MNARQYYQSVQDAVHAVPFVIATDLQFQEIDITVCYIRGRLILVNNFELHVAEYVITDPIIQRTKYRYHLQKRGGKLISRWDNVPHYPHISTFPHHRHSETGAIHESPPLDFPALLRAIVPYLQNEEGDAVD